MIVCFDTTALNDSSDQGAAALTQIFERFVEGRHQWCVPHPSEVLESAWFTGLGERDRRRVRELLAHAKSIFRASGDTARVMVGSGSVDSSVWWLDPQQAVFVLSQPLRIVLENQTADGAFLRALLFRFGERQVRSKLGDEEYRRARDGWPAQSGGDGIFCKVVHGGGSDTGKVLSAEWRTCPSSCLALVDSDYPTPPEPEGFVPLPGTTWEKVTKAAAQATVNPDGKQPRIVALRRREVENYVPQGALKAQFLNQSKAVAA